MPYIQALIFSVFLHLAAIWYLVQLKLPPPEVQPQVVEIVFESEKKRQFVTDPEMGKIIEKLQEQAKYLSQLNRQVEKELIARNSGKTQNAAERPMQQNRENAQKKETLPMQDLLPKAVGGYRPNPKTGEDSVTFAPDVLNQPSTISNFIPNVERGGFTALNTNRMLYYTFFARIEEQVRPRWVSNLRAFSSQLTVAQLNKLAKKTRFTSIEILLDMTGMHVGTKINESSGYPQLDNAAALAFADAAPFRNPPMDLIESDGYIHLRYGFYVEWNPSYFAGSRD